MPVTDIDLLKRTGIEDNGNGGVEGQRVFFANDLFYNLAANPDRIPEWWSPQRDRWLRKFVRKVDHLSSATNSMIAKMVATPIRVKPKNPNIRQHRILAQRYEDMLINNSGIHKGWHHEYSKFMNDYFTQDNGAFMLIMADGNKDEDASGYNRYGIQHLDSSRCVRTGDVVYPVVYTGTEGKRYKIHESRVFSLASMPSPDVLANGVGLCAISRAVDSAQAILDIAVYKGEKMGSRPLRAIATITGMTQEDFLETVKQHKSASDARKNTRFSHILALAGIDPIEFALHDLNSIPDGFDERTTITLAMYTIAMAFGVDPRELWPATESGATKADAAIQHQKALGKEPGNIRNAVIAGISLKFLPDTLYAEFDAKDSAEDEVAANIRQSRARYRKLEEATLSQESILKDMLQKGDIDEDVFQSELLDLYRMPDGDHIKKLFFSRDPFFEEHLNLGVEARELIKFKPENETSVMDMVVTRESEILDILMNRSDAIILQKARQAEKALEYVRYKYGGLQPEVIVSQIALANPDRDNEIEVVDSPLVPVNVAKDPSSAGNRSQGVDDSNADVSSTKPQAGAEFALEKDYASFKETISELFNNLFYQNIGERDFVIQMNATIETYYEEAYTMALAECARGILSEEVRRDMNDKIKAAKSYLPQFVAEVLLGDLTAEEVQRRASLWANGYRNVYTLARAFCDPSLRGKWRVDMDKEHCSTCLAADGTVLTLNEWFSLGILPQSPKLECGGWQCGCSIDITNEAVTGIRSDLLKALENHHGNH